METLTEELNKETDTLEAILTDALEKVLAEELVWADKFVDLENVLLEKSEMDNEIETLSLNLEALGMGKGALDTTYSYYLNLLSAVEENLRFKTQENG